MTCRCFWVQVTGSPFARLVPKIAEGLRANGCDHVESGLIYGSVHYLVEDQPGAVADLIERFDPSGKSTACERRGYLAHQEDGRHRLLLRPSKLRFGFGGQPEELPFSRAVTASLKEAAAASGVELLVLDSRYEARTAVRNGAEVVLEARNIVRKYSGITALQGVTFRVRRNQVNVLIGENGAGKSTLMRILAGAEVPTSGQVLMEGRPVAFRSTREATKCGIAMVYQELNILPNLNLAENIFAGREICEWPGIVDGRKQAAVSRDALMRLGSTMSTRTVAGRLPLGQQQIVELARSLACQARVLILDEPTSALSRTESETLFAVIADLKRHGVSIVYISHRLDELLLLGDFFTVLRDGKVAGEAPRNVVDRRWIVENMTGRALREVTPILRKPCKEDVVSVSDLTLSERRPDGGVRSLLQGVSFSAHQGEIVGVYGLLGSGRTELMETLAGLRSSYRGQIFVRGTLVRLDSVLKATKNGIALVPEDRKRDGVIATLSIRENISLAGLGTMKKGGFVSTSEELKRVRQLGAQLSLKAEDLELPVTSLSGGNQQKVVLARCLMRSPSILLLDEPTRGVDVGAKREIYEILKRLAETSTCIIFTSSELEEIRTLSDSILVLSRGRMTARTSANAASEEQLFVAACSHLAAGEELQ